jgi:hypothetical protein
MENIFCSIIGHFHKMLINQGLWFAWVILCTNLSTENVESDSDNLALAFSLHFCLPDCLAVALNDVKS